ncbi:permease prefix domain 1-containing protein [Priestia filamentosa]|uniref:permease prefix domain 1-containing protein n=1 Tax=Priestia filamentosa TaxID=1402861 RepID=UPI00397904EA
MKRIDNFVDSVYRNVGGKRKEIHESKAEMRNHLLEAVHELKLEGKSENEAIDIAIERFGGQEEMRSIVRQLFKDQRTFAKWVLYISVAILIISLSVFTFLVQNSEEEMNEQSLVATEIAERLQDQEVITPEIKEDIAMLARSTNHIAEVDVYDVRKVKDVFSYIENAKPNYHYEREVWSPKWLKTELFPYGNGDDKWFVQMKTRSFDNLSVLVLFVGIASYWILFSIWGIINAYHYKRLNLGWILSFIFFNVIGYLIFYLVGKRKTYI